MQCTEMPVEVGEGEGERLVVCGWSEGFLQCSALKCLGGWGKGRGQDLWCVVGQRGFCRAVH